MPIYTYQCPRGHVYERIQKMDEVGDHLCNVCDAEDDYHIQIAKCVPSTPSPFVWGRGGGWN